ncbi:chalcone isomerase family protein [Kaarinaea lacus]
MQPSTKHNLTLPGEHSSTSNHRLPAKAVKNLVKLVMISIIAAGYSVNADPLTTVSFNKQSGLQQVGTGTIRWFGFTIYDASLWTANGSFINLKDSLPVALHIIYRKNIKSTALAERTAEEWEQLNIYSPSERKQWKQQLATIWPTVKPGDSITTLVTYDKRTHFYYNNELIYSIDDPEFGIALLSIWLHPNTSQPELRSKLIGQREG